MWFVLINDLIWEMSEMFDYKEAKIMIVHISSHWG